MLSIKASLHVSKQVSKDEVLWCLDVSRMKLEMKQDWSCIEAKWQILFSQLVSVWNFQKLKKGKCCFIFSQFLLNCGFVLRPQLKYSPNIFHITHHIHLYGQLMCCLISSPLSTVLSSPFLEVYLDLPRSLQNGVDDHITQELHGMERNFDF